MAANGYTRREATAPKMESVGQLINKGPGKSAAEAMPSVKKAINRTGPTISKGPASRMPTVKEAINRAGK